MYCLLYVSGGPQVRFSIGAGDRQALQPPLSNTIPVTGTQVAMLFRQLGKKELKPNAMKVFTWNCTEEQELYLKLSRLNPVLSDWFSDYL